MSDDDTKLLLEITCTEHLLVGLRMCILYHVRQHMLTHIAALSI
jgi:hypothetical protein